MSFSFGSAFGGFTFGSNPHSLNSVSNSSSQNVNVNNNSWISGFIPQPTQLCCYCSQPLSPVVGSQQQNNNNNAKQECIYCGFKNDEELRKKYVFNHKHSKHSCFAMPTFVFSKPHFFLSSFCILFFFNILFETFVLQNIVIYD